MAAVFNNYLPSLFKYSRVLKASGIELHTSCHRCVQARKSAISKRLGPVGKTRTFRETGYLMLVIPVASLYLGVWQVKRRAWKLNLISELEARTTKLPVDFPTDLDALDEMEYEKVKVRGTFDHSAELYIRPRAPVEDDSAKGMRQQPQTGAFVVTAFQLADTNQRIMINRGWVVKKQVNPTVRQRGQVEGEIELTAVVRKTEKRPQFAAHNDVGRNHWFHRDIEAMADVLGTEEVFLDADRKSTVPGGPLGGQTRVTVRNEHLSYIFTWFSLSAITSAMWYSKYWKLR